jgi:hypothetical protein
MRGRNMKEIDINELNNYIGNYIYLQGNKSNYPCVFKLTRRIGNIHNIRIKSYWVYLLDDNKWVIRKNSPFEYANDERVFVLNGFNEFVALLI